MCDNQSLSIGSPILSLSLNIFLLLAPPSPPPLLQERETTKMRQSQLTDSDASHSGSSFYEPPQPLHSPREKENESVARENEGDSMHTLNLYTV